MSNVSNYTIVITEKGGKPRLVSFDQSEVTIGRVQGNDIVLAKGNISKRHSRIVLKDGKFVIVDLKSTNGTFVNGKRISAPQILKDSDKVYIGDYTLQVEAAADIAASSANDSPKVALVKGNGALAVGAGPDEDRLFSGEGEESSVGPPQHQASSRALANATHELANEEMPLVAPEARRKQQQQLLAVVPPMPVAPPMQAVDEPPQPARIQRGTGQSTKQAKSQGAAARGDLGQPQLQSPELPPLAALQARAATFLVVAKALGADSGLPADDDVSFEKARQIAEKQLTNSAKRLQAVDTSMWPEQIAREVCRLGPLAELLDDAAVVEVFINGPHQVLVRRGPDTSASEIPLVAAPSYFSSEEAVALVMRRVMHASGLKFDAEHPIAEARMLDGARVNAVHHAVAVRGPVVTVSRTNTRNATLEQLVDEQMLSGKMADFLRLCVRSRQNVVVCGGPGAGTGVLMSALAAEIPADERIVVVEQVARLRLPQPHVVTLEPRPLRGGPSAASMRDLVGNAVRMRPGRIIVNEVNGAEALELSMAMAGRQDGSLLSTSAGTARDCLGRLETMIRMAGLEVQAKVVREHIAASVNVVVAVTRFADGSSRVTQVAEVTGVEVDLVTTQDIFTFKRERFDDNGAVSGRFTATGIQPRFTDDLQRRGNAVNPALFRE